MTTENKNDLIQISDNSPSLITEEDDLTILQNAVEEFELSLGFSLKEYLLSKDAQYKAQEKLNNREQKSEGQTIEKF